MRAAENPFEMRRIESVPYRMSDDAWRAFDERLAATNYRGVIVGPHGSGKTTLLETLAHRLRGKGFDPLILRFYDRKRIWNEEDRVSVSRVNEGMAVLIDGGEVLNFGRWWMLRNRLRSAGAIIMTSHREFRLPTLYRCETDTALLSDLAHTIAPTHAHIFANEYESLYHAHNGNLRNAFRELYDRCAAM